MADITPLRPARPVVITLPDEIDLASARRVSLDLHIAIASGAPVVVADMTATTFCDSMGVRSLVMAHQRAIKNSSELRVVISSAYILRVLAITGVDRVLRIYPRLDAALGD